MVHGIAAACFLAQEAQTAYDWRLNGTCSAIRRDAQCATSRFDGVRATISFVSMFSALIL